VGCRIGIDLGIEVGPEEICLDPAGSFGRRVLAIVAPIVVFVIALCICIVVEGFAWGRVHRAIRLGALGVRSS